MKVKCIDRGVHKFLTVGKVYDVIDTNVVYTILNDEGWEYYYDKSLFGTVEESTNVLQDLVKEKPLTISSFLASMQPAAKSGVYQEVGKYTVIVYGQEFYADTEERLQEVMEALLVLYKEG